MLQPLHSSSWVQYKGQWSLVAASLLEDTDAIKAVKTARTKENCIVFVKMWINLKKTQIFMKTPSFMCWILAIMPAKTWQAWSLKGYLIWRLAVTSAAPLAELWHGRGPVEPAIPLRSKVHLAHRNSGESSFSAYHYRDGHDHPHCPEGCGRWAP